MITDISVSKLSDLYTLECEKLCCNVYPATTPKCLKRQSTAMKHAEALNAEAPKHCDSLPKIVANVTVFTMPGLGEITNDKCGQWVNALKCPNYEDQKYDTLFVQQKQKHDRFIAQHHCHNFNCPICYRNAAKRQAHKVTEKLLAGHDLYTKAGTHMGFFRHWVFSPDQEEGIGACMTLADAKKLRSQLYDHLRLAGCLGATVVFHPFRLNDPKDKIGRYIYEFPPYTWYPSPHFHVIGNGFLMKSNEFYKKTGWMYKMIREIDPWESGKSVESVINYIIGYQNNHCGIAKGWQSVTYFGLFHSSKLQKAKVKKIMETIECRKCGEALHSYEIILDDKGDMDWANAPDLGIFMRPRKKIIYKIRDGGRHGHFAVPEKNLPVYEEF